MWSEEKPLTLRGAYSSRQEQKQSLESDRPESGAFSYQTVGWAKQLPPLNTTDLTALLPRLPESQV